MEKNKVLVTGGAGFIGSHLTEKLVKKNFKVTVIDNLSTGRLSNLLKVKKKINFIKADISKQGSWIKKINNFNYIFHLAALADIVPSIENPKKYFATNVTGTFNIISNLNGRELKKFIYIGSSSCYGITKSIPTNEENKIDTQYPYALTKNLGEQACIHWSKVYNMPLISLRLFNVYGPRSRTSGAYGAVFGVFLAQKLANKPMTIVGSGKQKRDFIHVDDVVSCILNASQSKLVNEIFNVGSGIPISINYIAKLISGKKIYIPKRPGEPEITLADISKAQKMLKWQPKINIEEGVSKLISEIEYWKNAPVWTPQKIHNITKSWFKLLSK